MNRPSLSKMLKTVRQQGLAITGIETLPDGNYRVLTAAANEDADDGPSDFEARIRARKAQRAA